jgi:hypothetical protein
MSIQAYKVKSIELEKVPTFNAGEQENFDFIQAHASWTAYTDNGELCEAEFERETIEELCKSENVKEKEFAELILWDMAKAEYVSYNCF